MQGLKEQIATQIRNADLSEVPESMEIEVRQALTAAIPQIVKAVEENAAGFGGLASTVAVPVVLGGEEKGIRQDYEIVEKDEPTQSVGVAGGLFRRGQEERARRDTQTEPSLTEALDEIERVSDAFQTVLRVMRGGR